MMQVTAGLLKNSSAVISVAALALAIAASATAQNTAQNAAPNSASGLRLPQNVQVFGKTMPSVVKATAIINGDIITQTDIDQRLGLLLMSSNEQVPADELERVRQQVLRNLIDETLQIQAAKTEEIEIKKADIDRALERVAGNLKRTPAQLTDFLAQNGSSVRSIRRQIEGEIAWQRLQRAKIEDSVSVGDDEVKAVLDRMTASKGMDEYHVGEIFLSATMANQTEVMGNANKILEQLRNGASFAAYARQYSEASTAAVGGDLGWVKPEQLPEPLSSQVRRLTPGQVSLPIPVSGGVSILAVQDTRKVLTADPRDAVLSLKQVSIAFPKGIDRPVAEATVARFGEAARNVGGCGGADRIAAQFKGEIVQRDDVRLRDLPPVLQNLMMPMQVGQATQPFGTLDDGVRVFVICGRDVPVADQPDFDSIYAQLNEERTNSRARRYLRDLRRDAVIEFR
ncbi:MAG: peptidylprolyl isomerase [Sphingomicrobium sp.]